MQMRTWTHGQRPRPGASRRQTIGVVIDILVDGYQRTLFESMAHTAREQGVNVIAFVGGLLPSPHFDLISPKNVDALVVVGTIAHRVGPEGLTEFCRRFSEIPVVSIGVPVEGVTSIVPNGTAGVTALMTHLMAEHGRRRIAFIRGLGADGAERYEAFRHSLNEFGVEFREELVADGAYLKESGREAIKVLCDERRVTFDAVVAANDYMALGAVEALEARGFTVPKDIAVVGFDDLVDARNSVVPLTTVQQPIRELGRRAIKALLRQLSGRPLSEIPPIICHPVKRRSCGCVVETPFTRRPSNPAQKFASTESALLGRRELVLSDLLRTAQGELGDVGYHWEERLFDGIVDELRGASGNPFLSANEELSRRVSRSSGDVSTWQRVLAALRHHVLDCIEDNQQLRSAAENAFNDALLVSANVVGREESRRRTELESLLRNVIQTGNALVTARGQDEIARIILRHLAATKIPSCYLVQYSDDSRDRSQLLLGYDENLDTPGPSEPVEFDTPTLVPEGLLPMERATAYVLPELGDPGKPSGFALFEYDQREPLVFEALRDQINAALQAATK